MRHHVISHVGRNEVRGSHYFGVRLLVSGIVGASRVIGTPGPSALTTQALPEEPTTAQPQ
jgi:hypothetical protein